MAWYNPRSWKIGKSKKTFEAIDPKTTADGWNPRAGSPTPTPGEIYALSMRVDDLLKNDPYTERGLRVLEASVVGDGITPQAVSKTNNKELMKFVENFLIEYFDSTQCDASSSQNFYGMQSNTLRNLVKGNCFVRRRYRPQSMGLTIPFQFEVLSYDYLAVDHVPESLAQSHEVIDGIEYNKYKQPVNYFFYKDNPSNSFSFFFNARPTSKEVIRVPAKDVAHLFRKDESDQRSGFTWFAPIISTLRMSASYRLNVLTKQNIQSSLTALITSADTSGNPNHLVAGESTDDDAAIIKRGQMNRITFGESVDFPEMPDISGDTEFYKQFLRAMAAGLGMSYEEMSGDYSEVNYSSARMGWIAFSRNIKAWQKNIIQAQFLNKVSDWFLDGLLLQGHINAAQREDLRIKWVFPRREMLDPVKETNAQLAQIGGKIVSRKQVIEENGRDYLDTMQEIAYDQQIQVEFGISDSQVSDTEEDDDEE